MNLESISWIAIIDGKEHGAKMKLSLGKMKMKRRDITNLVKVMAQQMNSSLQKIITEKSGEDIAMEDVERLSKLVIEEKASPKKLNEEMKKFEKRRAEICIL